jgi:phosphoribosylglycinamide formyltransferase-1
VTHKAFRVVVLASGTGTNLQALLDGLHGLDGIEISGVASDKPEAQALERAAEAGVETGVFAAGDFDDRGRATGRLATGSRGETPT